MPIDCENLNSENLSRTDLRGIICQIYAKGDDELKHDLIGMVLRERKRLGLNIPERFKEYEWLI